MTLQPQDRIAGRLLRSKRANLDVSLRTMAARLEVTPAYVTDIELGRRQPSDALLCRIAKEYGIPENELRILWVKPAGDVNENLTSTPDSLLSAPVLLRTAGRLNAHDWHTLIETARKMATSHESSAVERSR